MEQCGCPSRARDAQEPPSIVCIPPPAGTQNIKHSLAGCRGISCLDLSTFVTPGTESIVENWFIPDMQVESGKAGSKVGAAAVEEGISPQQHGCCPTARHKTLLWELSTLAGIPFPCSQMKISLFQAV